MAANLVASPRCSQWAVIIGMNYYPTNEERCLRGCVLDAEKVDQYLRDVLTDSLDATVFTASTPPSHSDPPLEDPIFWPTYERVTRRLDLIIAKAKSGDCVYIHYSGHGARIPRQKQLECALPLLDCNGQNIQYLRLGTLAKKMDKMVENGVFVTLVLDCCFSGGMTRASHDLGVNVRFIDYDPAADLDAPTKLETRFESVYDPFRDASAEITQWLVSPKGYMVLAACSPEERAFEIEIGGKRQGAFTYFLLLALRKLHDTGIDITHHSLQEHLSTSLHTHWSKQTPMRYGKRDFKLFGDSLLASSHCYVPIYKNDDGHLVLRAGEVHGVYKGDEYAAYPQAGVASLDFSSAGGAEKLRVSAVRVFESDLEVVACRAKLQVTTGWKAKALTSLAPRVTCIGIMPSVTPTNRSLVPGISRYLRLVTTPEPTEHRVEDSCTYHVCVNDAHEYEVVDALLEKVISIPTIPCNSKRAFDSLINVLQHIAQLKYFEGVENRTPSPDFLSAFSIESKLKPGDSNKIQVNHGGKWSLSLKNRSSKQLYVGIFNFRPSWEVKALTASTGFIVLPPRKDNVDGSRQLSITMTVPEEMRKMGRHECEDVVKVFVTSKATYFRMSLPTISITASDLKDECRDGDRLFDFLSGLTDSFRNESESAWATRNFLLQTTEERPSMMQ
ncbi:hypothetical protein T440DRAFT_547062 [Plenodomus tracheiphilus IPT5]|uniref:Peptidase C14 caspase domain-containing protein n=1 Tax=Plenodomus tracheiphilus IPT5 TaxID=1408161 RepID=A0A6A7ANI0_9PLEO|nr:hypothetical protein T440DRAFT_547062 [Plenodomus tracheiphilus IPT5]